MYSMALSPEERRLRNRESQRKWREKQDPDKLREYTRVKAKEWRDRNPEKAKEVAQRASRKRLDRFQTDPSSEERQRTIASQREWAAKHRRQVLELLGGACKCGFSDPRALQIDHVHSNGAEHRRRSTSLNAYYAEIAANYASGDYQVLCANCNQIKRYEANETGRGVPRRKREVARAEQP